MRVSYRGREDGWVLTANKRGATFVPHDNPAAAAKEFQAQKEAFAAEAAQATAAAAAVGGGDDDRPLTGAKSSVGGEQEDRALNVGGKGSWVPPSSVCCLIECC